MQFALIRSSVVCAAVVFVGAGVQSIPAMASGQEKMSQDKMAKTETSERSYTGCVESGDAPQKYVLTHVAATEDHMAHDAMAKDSTSKSAMSPTTWPITSATVDL